MRRLPSRSVLLPLCCALAAPMGCVSTAPHLQASRSYATSASTEAYADGAGSPAPAAAPATQGAARSAESSVYDVTPAERPGLGTVFGETRYSSVREAEFERQGDADAPTFLASLHYNDAQGIDAQRNRLGGRYGSGEPMFHSLRASKPYLWGGVTISVVDEAGRPLPAYHQGDHVLLIGESGQRYAIRVENRTNQRFELVASVDGLDVVDGQLASLNKRGYIVGPHGRLVIDGYRRSMSEVAAFRFGSVRDSYAAQTGVEGDRNVGVIGVALFSERGAAALPDPALDDEAARREAADPFPGRFAAPPPPRAYY